VTEIVWAWQGDEDDYSNSLLLVTDVNTKLKPCSESENLGEY